MPELSPSCRLGGWDSPRGGGAGGPAGEQAATSFQIFLWSFACTPPPRLALDSPSAPASSFASPPSTLHRARLPLYHATSTLLLDDLYHTIAHPTEEAVAGPRRRQHPAPMGARRAVTNAGRRSSHRLNASRGASDGGRLSPLSGRAAGGSPAPRDSACPPFGRGGNSVLTVVVIDSTINITKIEKN
uniref:Uncharacterized protein n=1 Tax=Oryza rufipogon TaxID=4529 RepID=A0A0E0QN33_ORYRU